MTGSGRKNVVEFDPLLAVAAPHSNGHLFNAFLSPSNWQNIKDGYFSPAEINRTLSYC